MKSKNSRSWQRMDFITASRKPSVKKACVLLINVSAMLSSGQLKRNQMKTHRHCL